MLWPEKRSWFDSYYGTLLYFKSRFEGYITPGNAEQAKKRLLDALKADGVSMADDEEQGFFRCAQYGAVYQLAGRLNEMMLRVKP